MVLCYFYTVSFCIPVSHSGH